MDSDTKAIVDALKDVKRAIEFNQPDVSALDRVVRLLEDTNERLDRIEDYVERLAIEITERDLRAGLEAKAPAKAKRRTKAKP